MPPHLSLAPGAPARVPNQMREPAVLRTTVNATDPRSSKYFDAKAGYLETKRQSMNSI